MASYRRLRSVSTFLSIISIAVLQKARIRPGIVVSPFHVLSLVLLVQFSDAGEGPYGYSQLQGFGAEQVRAHPASIEV